MYLNIRSRGGGRRVSRLKHGTCCCSYYHLPSTQAPVLYAACLTSLPLRGVPLDRLVVALLKRFCGKGEREKKPFSFAFGFDPCLFVSPSGHVSDGSHGTPRRRPNGDIQPTSEPLQPHQHDLPFCKGCLGMQSADRLRGQGLIRQSQAEMPPGPSWLSLMLDPLQAACRLLQLAFWLLILSEINRVGRRGPSRPSPLRTSVPSSLFCSMSC